jgi:uncharacterized membrane protein YbaN (DUF454 family)
MDTALKWIKNTVLVAVGTVSLVVGIAGLFIPFFPGTPFLILAATCFGLLEF